MKERSLFAAYGQGNLVIGDGENLPVWNLAKDRRFFSNTTTEIGIVIMGRKSYLSLPDNYRPLPKRINIVITRNPLWVPAEDDDSVIVVHSLWEALMVAETLKGNGIAIIGGGEIYAMALENITFDHVYLTCVQGHFEGSVTLPFNIFSLLNKNYRISEKWDYAADDRNSHPIRISHYQRLSIA